jgi:hypothetical protein
VIELAHVKPLGLSKKFHPLDVAALSQSHTAVIVMTRTTQVPAFDNLSDDSSSDVREAPSQRATMDKHTSTPPSASGEFLYLSFIILTTGLDDFFL